MTTSTEDPTSEMLAPAPAWPEVWAQLGKVLAGREIVAYNAAFDSRLIAQTCAAHGQPIVDARWTCAKLMFTPLWPVDYLSLRQACHDLGVEPGTHRARPDAVAMVRAIHALADRLAVADAA